MTEVELAEKTIREFEDQKAALHGRTRLLTEQRKTLAYAANSGDKAARGKLNALNSEVSNHRNEIENIEFALTEANVRLTAARAAEGQAADQANALALRDKLAKFRELGEVLDDCFADFKAAATEQKKILDDIHQLGQAAPTAQQYRVLCEIALKTAVQQTPFWSQDFPAMAPNQRKTFKSIVDAWCGNIEANIRAVIGDEKEKKNAA
jgi:hypothetical protein